MCERTRRNGEVDKICDDIAILAGSEEELLETLEIIGLVMGIQYNMKINKNKPNVMVVIR